MKIRTVINGNDVSPNILKGCLNLTLCREDRDRTQTISGGGMELSNIYEDLDFLKSSCAAYPVSMSYKSTQIFTGSIPADSISFDPTQRIISCDLAASERETIDKLKQMPLWERLVYAGTGDYIELDFTAIGKYKRYFYSLDFIMSRTLRHIGLSYGGGWSGSSYIYFGGSSYLDSSGTNMDMEITCDEFIKGICSMYNLVWWISTDGKFHWNTKKEVLGWANYFTALNLPRIKGTTKITYSTVALKKLNVVSGDIIGWLSSPFTQTIGEDVSITLPFTSFDGLNFDGLSLIWSESYSSQNQASFQSLVESHYDFEKTIGNIVETDVSLYGNEEKIIRLLNEPFVRLWDSDNAPAGVDRSQNYYVTKAEINLSSDTAKITAKGYFV